MTAIATPRTTAQLQAEIEALERQQNDAHTQAVNAARQGDSERERQAIETEQRLIGQIGARREAMTQTSLDEATATTRARYEAIERVATDVLPRLEAEMENTLRVAQRERSAAAVQAFDLRCREVGALRSRLYELTSDMRRFHPMKTPNPAAILRDDPALESLWRRVRSRGPIDTSALYEGLPPL
jgi:hypothetical protein